MIKRFVRFEYDHVSQEFGNIQAWPIVCSHFGKDNKLLKAYRIDDKLYILFLERELLFVNEDFECSKKMDWETLFYLKNRGPNPLKVKICEMAYSRLTDEFTRFIIVFDQASSLVNQLQKPFIYNGDHVHDNSSLVMSCSLNRSLECLNQTIKDTKENLYLRNEHVVTLKEFSKRKMLVACQPRHLILF